MDMCIIEKDTVLIGGGSANGQVCIVAHDGGTVVVKKATKDIKEI